MLLRRFSPVSFILQSFKINQSLFILGFIDWFLTMNSIEFSSRFSALSPFNIRYSVPSHTLLFSELLVLYRYSSFLPLFRVVLTLLSEQIIVTYCSFPYVCSAVKDAHFYLLSALCWKLSKHSWLSETVLYSGSLVSGWIDSRTLDTIPKSTVAHIHCIKWPSICT